MDLAEAQRAVDAWGIRDFPVAFSSVWAARVEAEERVRMLEEL